MPKIKNAYARYALIDARLNNTLLSHPTLEDFKSYIEEKTGQSISISSIQKDIKDMRYNEHLGFLAPIIYDRLSRKYKYSEPFSINQLPITENDLQGLSLAIDLLANFSQLPEIKKMEEVLTKLKVNITRHKENSNDSIISLQTTNKYFGMQFLPLLFTAIEEKKIIYIDYQTFVSKTIKRHKIHPYFIKEFENRLYIIGKDIHPTKEEKILVYSFDRCHDVIVSRHVFPEPLPDRDNYFSNIIGISKIDSKPEQILLNCDLEQSKYLETNPIHHSQKIEIINEKEALVSFFVIHNIELEMALLRLGHRITVLSPQKLKENMAREAELMLKNYY